MEKISEGRRRRRRRNRRRRTDDEGPSLQTVVEYGTVVVLLEAK